MVARGHRLTVCRPRQPSDSLQPSTCPWQEVLFSGAKIPRYPLLRFGFPAFSRLRTLWSKERPDVVHVATEGPLGWSALRAASRLEIPLSSSFHTNFHEYSQHYGARWMTRPALAYLRWFHNRTRITLSPTRELNDALEKDGFRGVRLLARGVDTDHFTPRKRDETLRQRWGAGERDLVVFHVSRLAAEKNYPLLLKAWNLLRAAQPRAHFVLAGDGPLRKSLERQYPWVRFTGFLSREDLAKSYASADLFLFASLTETFGNVVTEAMASGLPVLAFDYAAPMRFIRSNENGVTVPCGAEDAFLQAARHLGTHDLIRRRLGRAARLTAETIPWGPVVDGFERDLRSLLAS
ncbi:MAG TPA: glycosyltransferase family 1 protein [Opitutaceae bacterium]|nr:glycosyltransferase family 1 protein [Opitutaceae bacterium]